MRLILKSHTVKTTRYDGKQTKIIVDPDFDAILNEKGELVNSYTVYIGIGGAGVLHEFKPFDLTKKLVRILIQSIKVRAHTVSIKSANRNSFVFKKIE